MPPGRPPLVNEQLLVDAVLKNRQEIICERDDGLTSIVPETNSIWTHISEELSFKIKPGTIYSYIVNNKFNLKNLVFGDYNEKITAQNNDVDDSDNETSIASADLSNFSIVPKDKSDTVFILTLGKSEFNDLIVETVRKYKDKKGFNKMRTVNVLKPQKWTEIVSKKIFEDFNLPHGYHFEYNYINSDKQTGTFSGHCKCGSRLTCYIQPYADHEQIVKLKCIATQGNTDCGKRQCRGETRARLVHVLEKESVEVYRARQAAETMKEGCSVEPPHLYSAHVLRNAKYQSEQKKYRDPNPMLALSKFKRSQQGQNVVHLISLDPIAVHFWSPHQIRIYNNLRKSNEYRICIDATGGMAKQVLHVNNEKSHHIFFYAIVLFCDAGQIPVASMFSEQQDTVAISTWLKRWIGSGAKFPREVVVDSSKALLNACCWSFTGHDTKEVYAEACVAADLPRTYIRIDVAHYLKNWSNYLNNEKKAVKRFYMFSIGLLILCRSQTEASEIVKALLIISSSNTAGDGATSLKKSLEFIKNSVSQKTPDGSDIQEIIDTNLEDERDEEMKDKDDDEEIFESKETTLQRWIRDIKEEVDTILEEEEGDDINPRLCPQFNTRLLHQLNTIPLWSCIFRDKFGFGRVPASSAPIESEFKIIKNQVLQKQSRLDLTVETLVKYYDGKLKLIDCSSKTKDKKRQEKISPSECPIANDAVDDKCERKRNSSELSEKDEPFEEATMNGANLERSTFDGPSFEDVSRISSACVACKNGNYPSGAHICILCKSKVHVLPGCSVGVEEEEEGYGERRLCTQCFDSSSKEARIAFRDVENWRGLGQAQKKSRRGLYLNGLEQEDIQSIDNNTSKTCKMPILKNGSDPNLGLVTIESTKFSLKNTCAFDSIFQILLAGVADHDEVKNCVQDNAHFNPLFEMITEAARSKIQSKTYRSRAEILLKFFKKTPKKNCIEEIFCQCNVVSLGNFLFSSTPSYQEISICPAGCPPRITSLPSITITGKEIHLPLGRVIEDHIVIPGVSCKQTGCREEENNQIHEIGKIVMVGLDCDENMTIESIPKSFECPKTGQEYGFLGAVLYQGPTVMTRRISAIGHYVALTKRGQKWTIYDDLHQKSTSVMKTVRVKPELIFYFKK